MQGEAKGGRERKGEEGQLRNMTITRKGGRGGGRGEQRGSGQDEKYHKTRKARTRNRRCIAGDARSKIRGKSEEEKQKREGKTCKKKIKSTSMT